MIRQVRKSEWEPFLRFLERSYGRGHGWGWFPKNYPGLYSLEEECLSCFRVIEKDGQIVSHVGLFPLEVIADGLTITIGGIGGVATLPEERGKGHMTKLLDHVIEKMHEKKMPLSFLGGDRHRYGNFGWEIAGEKVVLHMTERSMSKADIKPVPVKEFPAEEARSDIGKLYSELRFRVERSETLLSVLRKSGNRIWLTDDGYLCGQTAGQALIVNEVVSLSGKQTSLVRSVMEWCFVKQAEIALCREDTERLSRFMQAASYWQIVPEGMFRVNECSEVLNCFKPLLEKRARELKLGDFSLSLGLRFGEKVDVAGLRLTAGILHISKEKMDPYVELDERDGVKLLIGGPLSGREKLEKLSALLPVPIHIPNLDAV